MRSYYVTLPAMTIALPDWATLTFGLGLVDNQNRPLPAYKDPAGNLWFAGVEGQEFGIEVIVPDAGKYGLILSLDGLNTWDGTPATGDFRKDLAWVVDRPSGYAKNVIPGWVRAANKAARFTFAKTPESYVALMGGGEANCGVIGAKFCYAAPKEVHRGITTRSLGTGYGREVDFRTEVDEDFRVDYSREFVTVVVRYAPEAELIAAGFTPIGKLPDAATANPFPGQTQRPSCPPPPGWRPQ